MTNELPNHQAFTLGRHHLVLRGRPASAHAGLPLFSPPSVTALLRERSLGDGVEARRVLGQILLPALRVP